MLKNIVLLKWKEELAEEQLAAVVGALKDLPSKISEIKAISFGSDKKLVKGNADFAILTEFNSESDFQAYLVHPAHQALVGKVVAPLMAEMKAIQFEQA